MAITSLVHGHEQKDYLEDGLFFNYCTPPLQRLHKPRESIRRAIGVDPCYCSQTHARSQHNVAQPPP